jgi:hypothetical protein
MIRNSKALLLALLAVSVLGAMVATGAQASNFTVEGAGESDQTTVKIAKDGTGKTAHFVFDIRKSDGSGVLSLTCNEVTGDGVLVGGTPLDVHIDTPVFEGSCDFAGQIVTVENTGCNFTFTDGTPKLHITSEFTTNGDKCNHSQKPIHFENTALGCKVEIGEQTIQGIQYHNPGGGVITVESTNPSTVVFNATGPGCPYGTLAKGILTTSNFLLVGQKKGTEEAVNLAWDE